MRAASIVGVCLLTAVAGLAAPIEVDAFPSADVMVRSMEPTLNYGVGGALAASGPTALNSAGAQMGLLDSLLRFDVAGAVSLFDAAFGAGGWEIQSAVLRINEQTRPNNRIYNLGQGIFEIQWVDEDVWTEGTGNPKTPTTDGVSYGDLPAILSPSDRSLGTFANHGPAAPEDFVDIFCNLSLVDEFMADILSAGDVTLYVTAFSDDVGVQFAAKDNLDETSWPYLTLVADQAEVIPEPATASLVLAGLLACLRRRREPTCR